MTDTPAAPTTPETDAGKALVEWAENADPNQVHIWREHAALIEAEAHSTLAEAHFTRFIREMMDADWHKKDPGSLERTIYEAAARSTPADALDVGTVMRAIDAMKAPSEAGQPHGDWISVSVVRSILEGRHPVLAHLSRNEEADR